MVKKVAKAYLKANENKFKRKYGLAREEEEEKGIQKKFKNAAKLAVKAHLKANENKFKRKYGLAREEEEEKGQLL